LLCENVDCSASPPLIRPARASKMVKARLAAVRGCRGHILGRMRAGFSKGRRGCQALFSMIEDGARNWRFSHGRILRFRQSAVPIKSRGGTGEQSSCLHLVLKTPVYNLNTAPLITPMTLRRCECFCEDVLGWKYVAEGWMATPFTRYVSCASSNQGGTYRRLW
jgi:hypothetical protein